MRNQWLWNLIQSNYIWILALWLVVCAWGKPRIDSNHCNARDSQVFLVNYIRRRYFYRFLNISAVVYIFILVYVTLLGRNVEPQRHYELSFLWEYRQAFQFFGDNLNCLAPIQIQDMYWVKQIRDNILLFVPLGVLYGEFMRYCQRKHRIRFKLNFMLGAIFIGMMFSTLIEFIQLVFCLGWFEFDDIFNNCMGTLIGYGFVHTEVFV